MYILANSYSVIEGNRIVNIRDLMPGGSQTATPIDAYIKLQTDAFLVNTSDKANTYTKTEVDSKVAGMDADAYTTGQVYIYLNNKSDKASTYTKTEIDAIVSILTASDIEITTALGTKAAASNVYTKEEINANDIICATSLNKKADKATT
jgi:hypothetical protein